MILLACGTTEQLAEKSDCGIAKLAGAKARDDFAGLRHD